MSENGKTSNKLNNVQMVLYAPEYCYDVFPYIKKDWKTQICAGNLKKTHYIIF